MIQLTCDLKKNDINPDQSYFRSTICNWKKKYVEKLKNCTLIPTNLVLEVLFVTKQTLRWKN